MRRYDVKPGDEIKFYKIFFERTKREDCFKIPVKFSPVIFSLISKQIGGNFLPRGIFSVLYFDLKC